MNSSLYRYYIIDRAHHANRIRCNDALGEQYRAMGLSDVERMTRRFEYLTSLEVPHIHPEEQIALIDAFGDSSVGACWDFGHAKMMLADQPRQLRMLGKRLKATHVQDNNGKRDAHLIPFVGGNIEWEKIMPCLREIGYEGDFMLEAHHYTRQIPEPLWESAGNLAYEFGMYCMKMYHNA